MINLTDAELDELQQEAWNHPVPVARALAELRELREQKRYSDAGFASTLKRAVDRIGALLDENERLGAAAMNMLEALDRCESNRGRFSCIDDHDARCRTKWLAPESCNCGADELNACIDAMYAALASVKETTSV